MTNKRLEDLSPEEFQGMMEGMLGEDFDKVTVTEFLGALAAMDEAETRELKQERGSVGPFAQGGRRDEDHHDRPGFADS